MSECVVRMEMPKKCYQCDIRLRCSPFLTKAGQTKPMCEGCRIICSLPEGHGRLVDADALLRDIEKYHVSKGKFQHWLELQPTIVPAAAEGSET